MAINSVNSTNNMYNAIFANSAYNSTNSGGVSWLFGGETSNILGDYSMIKSGTYKKLLNSYYATIKEEDSSSSDSNSKKTTTETKKDKVSLKDQVADTNAALSSVRKDAEVLSKSAAALADGKLYEATGVDENGKNTYDRDGIEKAVKSFVSNYNAYLKTAGNMNNQSILGKTVSMTEQTKLSKQTLGDAGITINSDNTLSVDADKLKTASMSTLKSLFTGKGSFGTSIGQMSKSAQSIANSAMYTSNKVSSYSNRGSYSVLGNKSNSLNTFL